MPDLHVTIPGEFIVAYVAIGAALWLPLEWRAWRSIHRRRAHPFWRGLWGGLRRRPWAPLAVVAAWPLVVWESIPRRWKRRLNVR